MVVGTRKTRRAGATLLEFAIVTALLFMTLFAIMEFAKVLMLRQILQNASREGARYAVVHSYDKSEADIVAHVQQYLLGQQVHLQTPPVIKVFYADPNTGKNIGVWTEADFGECIAVTVTGDYRLNIPLLFVQTIPIHMKTIMYSEAN